MNWKLARTENLHASQLFLAKIQSNIVLFLPAEFIWFSLFQRRSQRSPGISEQHSGAVFNTFREIIRCAATTGGKKCWSEDGGIKSTTKYDNGDDKRGLSSNYLHMHAMSFNALLQCT